MSDHPEDRVPHTVPLSPRLEGLTEDDRVGLRRALDLGRLGWGRVHPNPMVGCVLVRDGSVVGEGWHREFGGPHAEVEALGVAGTAARGATAFVSLEPCSHFGKTPPCTTSLLDAGVRRVVFGARDPGPASGGGGEVLREAGVEVAGPCLTPEEARRENPVFFRSQRERRPFVALKLALSLDGKIAASPGTRTSLTGSETNRWVHRLRAGFDGLMVGSRTALIDNPLLTVRGDLEPIRPPTRFVLDRKAELAPASKLLATAEEAPTVLFVGEDVPESRIERMEATGATVHPVAASARGLSLQAVLGVCEETGVHSVLCEGGGVLGCALLEAGLVDRLYLLFSPVTLGSGGVAGFPIPFPVGTWQGWESVAAPVQLGRDVLLTMDRSEDV